MNNTAIFPGRYVQGRGALEGLGEEVARLGKKALIIAGATARKAIIPRHGERWREQFDWQAAPFEGECCDEQILSLSADALRQSCDIVIGVGGGKIIDTAKAVAHSIEARAVVVPTIASTDAPTSAVSVIYSETGEFQRYLFLPRNPDLVVVDTEVIAQAPVRFLVAGMGDGLATWFEADSCRRSRSNNQCGGLATRAALSLARLCYETLLEFGPAAVVSCRQKVVTPALSHVIEANTLLSGLGFESAGLAAAHSIHNGLTRLPGAHAYYHGEKVAVGTLAGMFLADLDASRIEEVYQFCETVGLPTRLVDIGLEGVSDEELRLVSEAACAEGETIHHEAGEVTPEAVFAALKTADAYGCQRRS